MKITDNNKIVNIEMKAWNGSGYGPDMALDILQDGSLRYDAALDAYVITENYRVDDVISFAQEWERGEDESTIRALYDVEGDDDAVEHIREEIKNRCAIIEED